MADNYLEKRQESYKAQAATPKKQQKTLSQLLSKNRSHRSYDTTFIVRADQLRRIIAVNTKTASSRNQQVFRFRPVLSDETNKILPHISMGSALRDIKLPCPESAPNAFIIICSTEPETRTISIDLGISAQSMLLQAVEIGLNGICIGAFDKEAITNEFNLPYEPLLLLAIGKGTDCIKLVDIQENEPHSYYRKEGVHYVPKIVLEDILIKQE